MDRINRTSKLPLYRQLYEILRGDILHGKWQPGDMLPPESELVKRYQISRSTVRQGEESSYDELTYMAAQADPLQSVVDLDYGEFLKPGDMPARVRAFCQMTDQPVPQSKGAVIRCALESLALKYRWVLERLEEILARRLEPIHIMGGGTQNRLLNQFAADTTGRRVIAGPIEATAAGNVITQAMALGHIASLEEGRIVRNSFDVATYEPAGGLSGMRLMADSSS